ncbi:uncharacterized protein LOC133182573 [Saccostrea echinata]|uniref:uncharacterized protein LOC133182573 n=1 Tax=Saccostrea echinata TaxID=191078 RepID=UPI002A80B107|nr:uncharacterized protein LOC133182573 [Saccostrea echinata]
MEALKSYFSKFRKHRSVSGDRGISPNRRKRNKFRKRSLNENLSDEEEKNGKIEHTDFHKSNVSAVTCRSIYENPLLKDTLTNSSPQEHVHKEKMSPPAKPPRKDQVFSVTFQDFLPQDLGIIVGLTQDQLDYRARTRLRSDTAVESGSPCDKNSVIRIIFIKEGSAASENGQVHVDDEVISVNGWNMTRENTGSARLLLANAVRSGKVTMTLRRKKKRPAPPPPTSQDTPSKSEEDQEKENKSIMTQSLDSLPGNSGGHDNWYLGNRNDGSSLTLDSMGSLGNDMGSIDDVFIDNSEDHSLNVSRQVFQHQMSESAICVSPSSQISKSDYVNVNIGNKNRTHSASVIEDAVEWNTVPINLTQDVMDTVNTAQMTLKKRGKVGSLKNSTEQDTNMYSSDPELISINTSKHLYKKNKKGWRYHQDRGGTQTPTSCYSSDSGSSSHVPKKRIVTKLHLLKDENGLGIHIAGGRGSKKGDIGIFVAGITEGGAAFRDGRLKRGDELLMINGKSLIGLSHCEAVDVLRNSPKLVQVVVASKVRKSSSVASTGSSSVPSLCSIPTSQQLPTEVMTPDLSIPEVTAQTPSGTVFNWEDLMQKFDLPLDRTNKVKTEDNSSELFQTVTINKGARGKGLGFTIVGGSDSERGSLGIYVRRILSHGLVAEEGSIKEGDEILKVNDQPMKGLSHKEAIQKFRQLKKGPVSITFCRRSRSRASSPSLKSGRTTPVDFSSDGSPVSTPGHSPSPSFDDLASFCDEILGTQKRFSDVSNYDNRLCDSIEERMPRLVNDQEYSLTGQTEEDSLQEILLHKENGIGLGISLIRKDCKGVSQIFIQDIYTSSPADKDGRLRRSDQIVEVNGKPLQGLSLLDAYQSFRSLKAGPIVLVIKRGGNFLTISLDLEHSTASQSKCDFTQNSSAECGSQYQSKSQVNAAITKMDDKIDDLERTTKAVSPSEPVKIRGKSKMEGSTTDSDFSDLDIQTFAEKSIASSPPSKSVSSLSGSPHKRGYHPYVDNFNTGDFYSEQNPKKRNLNQYPFGPGKENLFNLNWTNSESSRDSALGGSLMSALGSVLTDTSSSYETNSDSEQSLSGHSVYGRYQKIDGSSGESSEEEVLVLHRLPGENLGMILGIDSDPTCQTVKSVYVKTVTIGGAAYRATGSKKGIQEGDQILQINGTDLNILTHDECLTVLREMPLRVILKICRGKKRIAPTAVKLSPAMSLASSKSFGDSPSPLVYSETSSYSESEEEEGKFDGFVQIHVEIDKHPNESLGLSIVPSYGSTRQFYQIKRLLPSGAAARSQHIRVGDRLVSCNGISLRNVSQAKCLSILKSEGNSGDLELELLRPKENEDQLEISLKVSNTDSTLTLHSPSQQRKNFIADLPESDSDNEVVLNKFQYFDKTGVGQNLSDQNQKSEVPNIEKIKNSDNNKSKRDFKFTSENSKMDESSESWNYAVPPPVEFSTYGPAVPPPAEFSEGQSPIFNQSNNGIPVTNIDEIIKSYSQSPVVQSHDSYIPQTEMDDTEVQIRQLESLTGLHGDENGSLDNSLTYFNENLPGERELDMMDSFQGDNDMNNFDKEDQTIDEGDDVESEPFIPPAPVNTEDIDLDVEHSNSDDEFVVPVTVQRNKNIPFASTVIVPSAGPTEIEEEQIIPSVEQRKRTPVSATIKLDEVKKEELPTKPVPQPRVKPTIISVKHESAPPKSSMDEDEGVMEEIVRAEFKERQSANEKFNEKLHVEVEEEIVPVVVKKDQSWNAAKIAVITNMWSKSASKSKESVDDHESKNLKSVINVINSKKKKDNTEDDYLAQGNKMETAREETENSQNVPREQEVYRNVIEVTSPVSVDVANVEKKTEKVDSVAPSTDKYSVSKSSEPVDAETSTQQNVSRLDTKPDEKESITVTSEAKSVQETAPISVSSKAREDNVSSSTSSKTTEASPVLPFKSSIGITKPSSLLSTIRSQNSSSATLRPLSSIKPITVSAKTFSLGKPSSLSSSLSSGRPSLLSTIHGTTTSTKNTRSEEEPFLVRVLKGILGLGLKVSITPEGFVKVDEIQPSGPIAKDGNIRVGDFLLSINNTELTGLPDSKVQQILRLLPRGIAKILVSVKPPSSEGVARPTDLSLGNNDSRQSPLSSPRTMSKSASLSPSLSPRQRTSSPLSPQQPSIPSSKTPVEESSVKVTVNHNQLSPETNKTQADESTGRVTVKHDQYAPGAKKTPPPVAPKPKQTSSPDHVSKTGSHWGGGGYVSSALGRTSSFGKKESHAVDSKPHIQPKKADYVSSARKTVHEKEEKEPIDTVVFASVDFNKMNAMSRQSMGQSKDKNSSEPKMIPKGHVDYVSSAKPKVSSLTTTSPQKKDFPYSPYAYEEVSTKISPVKMNSALSPRRKSEDKFSFGASFSGNRTKGKMEDQHTTGSPLTSPKSPVTPTTQHSPNIKSSLEAEIVVGSPPEVPTKPVPKPRGSISDKIPESTELDSSPANTMPSVESIIPSVENTDQVIEQPCVLSTDQLNITYSFEENVHSAPEAQSIDIDVVNSTESQKDTAAALTKNNLQDNNVISPDIDLMNVDVNISNVEVVNNDSDVEDKKDKDTSESLIVDDSDNELYDFVEEIVRNAIQKGIDEFKASEAEDKPAEDDEAGKKVDNKLSRVHDTHPVEVMETKGLRAFLQKFDSSEKEMPSPVTYSMNQNPVAENIAAEMLTCKTLQEDSDNNARHTNSATKTSASTSNDLLTHENSGVQVDQCMSVSHDASVACNDVVLDSPNPVSMSVDVVNVPSVASVGDNIVNTLLIQEPKLCTEQLSEDPYPQHGRDKADDNVNSDVNGEDSQGDLENIEIVLNEESVDSSPIDLLGGDISQTELNSGNYSTIKSQRSWFVCFGKQQLGPNFSNVEDIGGSLDQVSPEELETLLNKTNSDLDSYGVGLDAMLVLVFLDSNFQGEGPGVQLTTDQGGFLMISEVMEGGLADREGHIQKGDKVISLDGMSTASLSPEAVMNGINNTLSSHVIVLTRAGEESDNSEAPPTPEAPPPALPVSQPPDIPKEDEIKDVKTGSSVEELSGSESENKITQEKIHDLKVEIPSENVDTHEDNKQNSDLEVIGPGECERTDSITVTIPEVSSPQGSQDSGVEMPSPLDSQSTVVDTASTEKPYETEQLLSNGELNQVSSPTSPLVRIEQLLPTPSDDSDDENVEKDTFEVVMNKGVTGLGFLIEGGKASAKGDQPLTIRRMFKGGPAEKCGMLKVKDEILKVNGLDITNMRHSEAWTHLKFLDDGPVHLLIRRKVQQSVE